MATPRQINANRENAQKSTGPISDEGQRVGRSNALKHGLAARLLLPPGMEGAATEQRAGQWLASFRPFEAFDVWLVATVAAETIRIDRCRVHEAVIRERIARRAADDRCWDDDRRIAVDALAVNLAKRPDIIACKLRQTMQGVDWLLDRWTGLAQGLASGGAWGEAQRTLALDLLGVPRAVRGGRTAVDAPADVEPSRWHAAVTEREVRRLRDLQQMSLSHWDANDREAAMAGVEAMPDPALRLVRRYERASNRRLEWAIGQLQARTHEPMPPLPERNRPLRARRPSDQTEATEPERGEHGADRLQAWSEPAETEVVHDFAISELLVAAAVNDPSPAPEPASVVFDALKRSDALRPPMSPHGNRRARRAAAKRARQGH